MLYRRMSALLIVAAVVAACASETTSSSPTTPAPTTAATTEPTVAPTTAAPTTPATTTAAPTTAPPTTTAPTTTVPVATTAPPTTVQIIREDVIAVWPAEAVEFGTPEEAAEDFIAAVFGVEPLLGEYMGGDARSGEFDVLSPLDDDDPATTSSQGVIMGVRLLNEGWYVIGAMSEGVTITSPEARAIVPAAPLEVSGLGRGFEGTVVVRAIPLGAQAPLDLDILITSWDPPVPYTATVDLSAAQPGDVIAIIASGDTGIAATGEFAAIPVVIGES